MQAQAMRPSGAASAELGDGDEALEAGGARRRLDDLERVDAGLGRDGVGSAARASREEGIELQAQRLVAARNEVLLAGVDGFPGTAVLTELAGVERHGRGAVVGDQR